MNLNLNSKISFLINLNLYGKNERNSILKAPCESH